MRLRKIVPAAALTTALALPINGYSLETDKATKLSRDAFAAALAVEPESKPSKPSAPVPLERGGEVAESEVVTQENPASSLNTTGSTGAAGAALAATDEVTPEESSEPAPTPAAPVPIPKPSKPSKQKIENCDKIVLDHFNKVPIAERVNTRRCAEILSRGDSSLTNKLVRGNYRDRMKDAASSQFGSGWDSSNTNYEVSSIRHTRTSISHSINFEDATTVQGDELLDYLVKKFSNETQDIIGVREVETPTPPKDSDVRRGSGTRIGYVRASQNADVDFTLPVLDDSKFPVLVDVRDDGIYMANQGKGGERGDFYETDPKSLLAAAIHHALYSDPIEISAFGEFQLSAAQNLANGAPKPADLVKKLFERGGELGNISEIPNEDNRRRNAFTRAEYANAGAVHGARQVTADWLADGEDIEGYGPIDSWDKTNRGQIGWVTASLNDPQRRLFTGREVNKALKSASDSIIKECLALYNVGSDLFECGYKKAEELMRRLGSNITTKK